jgi:hypothetical protein
VPACAPAGGDVDDADPNGQRLRIDALHLEVHRDTGTATNRNLTLDEAAAEDRVVLFARADQPALGLLVEEAQLAAHAGVRHSAIPRVFAAAFFAERRSFKVFCAGFFCALFGFWEPFKPISFVVLHTEGTAHLVTLATFRGRRAFRSRAGCPPLGQYRARSLCAMMQSVDTDRRTSGDVRVFGCAECPRVSSVTARGWRAYRVADPDEGGQPELLFICPDCARREFEDD